MQEMVILFLYSLLVASFAPCLSPALSVSKQKKSMHLRIRIIRGSVSISRCLCFCMQQGDPKFDMMPIKLMKLYGVFWSELKNITKLS
jgi:hypothetical protein